MQSTSDADYIFTSLEKQHPFIPVVPTAMDAWGSRNPNVLLTLSESSQETVKNMQNSAGEEIPDYLAPHPNSVVFKTKPDMQQIQIQKWACFRHYWHKFLVFRGAGYSKVEVMHALMEVASPHLFTPVLFRREGVSLSFFATNCFPIIEKLIQNGFQIHVRAIGPKGLEVQTLDLELTLGHTSPQHLKVQIHEHLTSALKHRYEEKKRHLDLSAFHSDPELSEVVYWTLWPLKSRLTVINLARQQFKSLRSLNLANNELKCAQMVQHIHTIEVLDLSGNKIENLGILHTLRTLPLKDLVLNGNPLCEKFADEASYIRAVKEIAPNIKKLDGVCVCRMGLPCWRQNYVPQDCVGECLTLVDQFLRHFFTLVDGDNRQHLRGTYHDDALFSLLCTYVPGQSTSSTARLTRYTMESRNLLRLSDYSKSEKLLNQGGEAVLAALCRLPRTEHDPCSFAVDVPYFTEECVMIVVNGVFREPSRENTQLVRAFSRTFVLHKVASREYQIVNEMLSISNASTKQAKESFQFTSPEVPLAQLSFNPVQDLSDSDREKMTRIFSRLTEMNQRWAKKCLAESKWDIKDALLVFRELLTSDKLPAEAFSLEGK